MDQLLLVLRRARARTTLVQTARVSLDERSYKVTNSPMESFGRLSRGDTEFVD